MRGEILIVGGQTPKHMAEARRKDVQYEEMKATLRPHRTRVDSDGVHVMREPVITRDLTLPWSQGELWKILSRDCHAQTCASGKPGALQQGGRKVTSEEGARQPCPRECTLSITSQGGHKRGLL